MPQNSEQGEPGRVHAVGEVKIGLSRRDFRSLLLVRRRLQGIWEEGRFATPTEVGGLYDVMRAALGTNVDALLRFSDVSRETGMVSYVGEDEEDGSDEGV